MEFYSDDSRYGVNLKYRENMTVIFLDTFPSIHSVHKIDLGTFFLILHIVYNKEKPLIFLGGEFFMGKQIRYTSEFKMKVVQIYLQGDLSANQLAIELGIHPHTIRHWIQNYNDGKMEGLRPVNSSGTDFSDVLFHGQTEYPKRADIGMIISKFSALECELNELKTLLQSYLLR